MTSNPNCLYNSSNTSLRIASFVFSSTPSTSTPSNSRISFLPNIPLDNILFCDIVMRRSLRIVAGPVQFFWAILCVLLGHVLFALTIKVMIGLLDGNNTTKNIKITQDLQHSTNIWSLKELLSLCCIRALGLGLVGHACDESTLELPDGRLCSLGRLCFFFGGGMPWV